MLDKCLSWYICWWCGLVGLITALGQFAAECETGDENQHQSEVMDFRGKRVYCPLAQVKEFKYLRVLFMGGGRLEQEKNRWFGAAFAVMQTLYQSVMVKIGVPKGEAASLLVILYSYPHLWPCVVSGDWKEKITSGQKLAFPKEWLGSLLKTG